MSAADLVEVEEPVENWLLDMANSSTADALIAVSFLSNGDETMIEHAIPRLGTQPVAELLVEAQQSSQNYLYHCIDETDFTTMDLEDNLVDDVLEDIIASANDDVVDDFAQNVVNYDDDDNVDESVNKDHTYYDMLQTLL